MLICPYTQAKHAAPNLGQQQHCESYQNTKCQIPQEYPLVGDRIDVCCAEYVHHAEEAHGGQKAAAYSGSLFMTSEDLLL